MLGKLVKNEIKSYTFPFGIMFLAGFIFTIFMKVICMLPYQEGIREMVQLFGFYGYYYLIMVIGFAAQVLIVIRFYSTMVGDRGYLTWTLPASSSTHIWVKLIGGVIWKIISTAVIILLVGIFIVGDYWTMMGDIKIELEGFLELFENFKPEYIIPIVLAVVAGFIWSVVPQILFYLCISIGQLFGKWRIPASIGCYFVIVIALQVVFVIGIVILSIFGVSVVDFNLFANANAILVISMIIIIFALIGVGLSAIMFAVTNSIFKKHLNLE